MVIKVKVSDVAAGFGVQNKEVLDLLPSAARPRSRRPLYWRRGS